MWSRAIRRVTWLLGHLLAVAVLTPIASATAADAGDPFAACRQRLAQEPADYESAYCFYDVTLRQRLWDQGARVFKELMRADPGNSWLTLAYGHLYRERDPDAAERLYRLAAEGFRAAHHPGGEIQARSSLRNFLYPKGRVDEANAEVARIVEVAASVDDPLLKAQVWTIQASHIQDTGGDLGLAYRLLKQSERAAFPDGPYRLKRTCLTWLGLVAFRLGNHAEAIALFERLDALARAENDAPTQADAQYNLLNSSSLKESQLPTTGARERLTQLAARTLATALAVGNQRIAMKTHRTIAALLANQPGRNGEALRHVEECLATATAIRQPQDEAVCAWLQASLMLAGDPARATAAQIRALRATERANSPLTNAYSAGRHMQFSWRTKPRAEAIRDSLRSIDAIEALRSLQDDDESSARLFTTWTLEYYWLAGRILLDGGDGDLDAAFAIAERLRARSLLDVLDRSRFGTSPQSPAAAGHRALRTQITARTPPPSFATIGELQATLADNEAMLSYQLGIWETYEGEFGGGSWLVVLTRHGRSLYRIPDRSHFAPQVPIFNGLLLREDGIEGPAAARLYDEVFHGALERLPPEIDRLVVIPDGPLQSLPFDALRQAPAAPPLAMRYELVVAPSATLWLQWRTTPPLTEGRRALAFADPELDEAGGSDAYQQALTGPGVRLGRLPHARRESRAIERHLGSLDALVGRGASERALKERDLRRYGLVHFAVHAISDESHPERSAVRLAPGADDEDGLLQAREIQALDFQGRIVVLSACETASGAVLNGEGVLSLARSFFAAGARSVLGTRWPIRDQDAAALFEAFYQRLGEGASLAQALARAKTDAIAAGRPAAVWASVELLGDGAIRPFADRSLRRSGHPWSAAVLILAAVFVVACGAWVRVRRTRMPAPTECR